MGSEARECCSLTVARDNLASTWPGIGTKACGPLEPVSTQLQLVAA